MTHHANNWLELAIHTVSFFSALTFAIAVAHRLVQISWESLSKGYPTAGAVLFMSPTGPLQKALSVAGDLTAHFAQLGRELIAPKAAWDGPDRRAELQSQAASVGK